MSNSYYNRSRAFQPNTVGNGADVRHELNKVAEAFDKLPEPVGDGSGFSQPLEIGEGIADGHMLTKQQTDDLVNVMRTTITEGFTADYQLTGGTTEVSILNRRVFNIENLAGGTLRLVDIPTNNPILQFVLRIKDAGKYAITWPTGFKWAGNNKPDLKVSGIDQITITLVIGATLLGTGTAVTTADGTDLLVITEDELFVDGKVLGGDDFAPEKLINTDAQDTTVDLDLVRLSAPAELENTEIIDLSAYGDFTGATIIDAKKTGVNSYRILINRADAWYLIELMNSYITKFQDLTSLNTSPDRFLSIIYSDAYDNPSLRDDYYAVPVAISDNAKAIVFQYQASGILSDDGFDAYYLDLTEQALYESMTLQDMLNHLNNNTKPALPSFYDAINQQIQILVRNPTSGVYVVIMYKPFVDNTNLYWVDESFAVGSIGSKEINTDLGYSASDKVYTAVPIKTLAVCQERISLWWSIDNQSPVVRTINLASAPELWSPEYSRTFSNGYYKKEPPRIINTTEIYTLFGFNEISENLSAQHYYPDVYGGVQNTKIKRYYRDGDIQFEFENLNSGNYGTVIKRFGGSASSVILPSKILVPDRVFAVNDWPYVTGIRFWSGNIEVKHYTYGNPLEVFA
mgnify:CR=1 FL=1